MQKTRFGISVGLMGAAIYFVGLFGGYTAMLLLAGYVLLFEENGWLRRASVKAVAVVMLFSLLATFVGFIPDVISMITNVHRMSEEQFSVPEWSGLSAAILNGIEMIKCLLLIILGFRSLKQRTVVIPLIDRLIDRHT